MMRDWQDRVQDERYQLAIKHNKLCKFIDSPTYSGLSEHAQDQLTRQARVMGEYHGILTERMADFVE